MNHKISVIIPVIHEQHIINRSLTHLYNMIRDKKVEIVVAEGDPEGNTLGTIVYPEVRVCIAPKGRGNQMNCGAELATGDILLFLHADTYLPENAFDTIVQAFEDQNISAGAFDLGIDSPKKIFRLIETLSSLRSEITRIPYGDQAIFIKRSVFEDLGGFADIPLMEDVDLMRRIKSSGRKIFIADSKVRTSARRWEKEGIAYCTLRNWTLISLYFMGVSPVRLAKYYFSQMK